MIPGCPPELVQDDSLDAAESQGAQHQPWQPVWSRLHDMALDRSHRAVAWKTHGILPCGALLSFAALRQLDRADIQPLIAQAMCPHCLPLSVPAETLTHILLEWPSLSGTGSAACGQHTRELRLRRPQLRFCWQMTRGIGAPLRTCRHHVCHGMTILGSRSSDSR